MNISVGKPYVPVVILGSDMGQFGYTTMNAREVSWISEDKTGSQRGDHIPQPLGRIIRASPASASVQVESAASVWPFGIPSMPALDYLGTCRRR